MVGRKKGKKGRRERGRKRARERKISSEVKLPLEAHCVLWT
jgi:hypothetical protein